MERKSKPDISDFQNLFPPKPDMPPTYCNIKQQPYLFSSQNPDFLFRMRTARTMHQWHNAVLLLLRNAQQ